MLTNPSLAAWDTYGFGRPKNLRMFVRPADEKVIPLMWDCDRCPMDRTIKQRVEATSRLDEIRDIPHNLRVYWGHMYDFMNTSFTNEYTTKWAAHFSALAGGRSHGADGDFSEVVTKMRARIPEATRDMERDIPRVDFDITSNDGNDLQVDQPSVMLEGKGWVDIRYLRLAGTEQPLSDVFWPESDSWQVTLPLAAGNNEIAIEAIDYRGNLIGTETINVTSTEGDAVSASLRVDEVYYHPSDPTAAEAGLGYDNADDFEYLEFTNIGTETIPLSSVSLVRVSQNDGDQGVDFDFADGLVQELEPGASVIVVEDLDAFQARFGSDLPVAGQWSGGLSNGGEMITVENAGVLLQQFTYDDAWYPNTDGAGRSLQILEATNPSLDSWNSATSWRPSSAIEGSPGGRANVIGDSNGDGVFDSADMLLVFQAGEYEDDVPMNSTFAEGDWDGDGDFTTRDIVWVFMHGVFDRAGLAATPSPVVRSLGSDNLSRSDSLTGTETSEGGGSEQNPGGAMLNRRAPALIEQTAVDSVFASREFGSESQQDARDEWDFGDAEVI